MEKIVIDWAFIFRSCVTDRQYSGHFGHKNKTFVKKIDNLIPMGNYMYCVLSIFLSVFNSDKNFYNSHSWTSKSNTEFGPWYLYLSVVFTGKYLLELLILSLGAQVYRTWKKWLGLVLLSLMIVMNMIIDHLWSF